MNSQISNSEIERQVLLFMSKIGASPASYENLILDGQLHRYDVDGDKRGKKNGAYIIHTDGYPAGYVQNWKTGVKENWR